MLYQRLPFYLGFVTSNDLRGKFDGVVELSEKSSEALQGCLKQISVRMLATRVLQNLLRITSKL